MKKCYLRVCVSTTVTKAWRRDYWGLQTYSLRCCSQMQMMLRTLVRTTQGALDIRVTTHDSHCLIVISVGCDRNTVLVQYSTTVVPLDRPSDCPQPFQSIVVVLIVLFL